MTRRSRNYPAATRATHSIAADWQAELDELVAASDSSEKRGRTIIAVSEQRHAAGARKRFEQFLTIHGVDGLDELRAIAERDESGYPIVPAALLVTYLAEIARPGTSRGTLRHSADKVIRAMRAEGWALPQLLDGVRRSRTPLAETLQSLYAHIALAEHRPARPVLPGAGLEDIARTLDQIQHPELRQSLLTFHAVSFWAAGRISEMTCRFTWSWLDDHGQRMRLTYPAGLKYQKESLTLPLDLYPVEPLACAVTQLRLQRRMLEELGIPTGPDDLVLPGIDTFATGASSVITDPILALTEDPSWQPEITDPSVRRAYAEANHAANYRRRWIEGALAAGFTATPQRRVSPHGLRRGLACALDAGGASIAKVQTVLRHGAPVVTFRYVDGSERDLSFVNDLLDLEDGLDPSSERPGLSDLAALLHDDRSESPVPELLDDGRCSIHDLHGDRCTRASLYHLRGVGAACTTHIGRITSHGPGDPRVFQPTALVEMPACEDSEELADDPIPNVRAMLGDLDWEAGCTATWEGIACGQRRDEVWSFVMDGRRTILCFTHIQRYLAGHPDWDRPRPQPGCEVEHIDGHAVTPCGKTSICTVDLDDGQRIPTCTGHYQRWKAGKRGSAFTRPLRERTRSAVCEALQSDSNGNEHVCGYPKLSSVSLEDGQRLPLCEAHYARWRRGEREADLQRPMRRRRPIAESKNSS